MIKNDELSLRAWREVGRHGEIHEFTVAVRGLIEETRPVPAIFVRRWELENPSLVTVAWDAVASVASGLPGRSPLSPTQNRAFQKWCQTNEAYFVDSTCPLSRLLLPVTLTGNFLLVPLFHARKPSGVLGIQLPTGKTDESAWRKLIERLREPFEVALENDRRIHELAALREAAEAERGALLQRLGRSQLDDTIVGAQSGLRGVMERVRLVAGSDVPVLVLGETGSGKEVVARALHHQGRHPDGPFIRVNCGAIPAELVDTQLFGHEKGAFTGAERSRAGWFERANGGTLFLDEVGELPLPAQVRLLRVLQDGLVERVGSQHSIHVVVRVIAATHRDLAAMVSHGKFREDLWYRLAVFPILIPPLRERRDDIADLAAHFARRAALRFGLPVANIGDLELRLLRDYSWPGNIRELAAVIDRAAILGAGKKLDVENALGWNADTRAPSPATPPSAPTTSSTSLSPLEDVIRQHIETALTRTRGRVEGPHGAAALLEINPHTLRSRMRKLGIQSQRFK